MWTTITCTSRLLCCCCCYSQWQDVYTVDIPQQQIPVTEQLIRSLAANDGQLTFSMSLCPPPETGAKKPPAPAPVKGEA